MRTQAFDKHTASTRLAKTGLAILCAGLCLIGTPCRASEPPSPLPADKLQLLARDFVSRVGGKLKEYDTVQAAENAATGGGLSLIPDGELLLLRPKSEKFVMDSEIGAVKKGNVLYYSLRDVIDRLELSIDYDPAKGIASGWFLREDWLMRMDLTKKEVVSRGETYAIAPEDTYREDGEVYISQQALQKWLAIETEPDIAQQYLNIRTPYPYPALARNYRERNVDGRRRSNAATLPRLEKEEEMLDINIVETQQTVRVRQSQDRSRTTSLQNITAASGELLNHNAYGIAFWDNEENLTSIRGRLTKESERPDLLGPLQARSYTVGDTELSQLPLTGTTSEELGFRVNNNPLRNADFQRTTISGDSLPGWDVELYRDGFLVDRIRVEEDARYEFPEIELYAGDNLFEVMFYGPQGEIRREEFNIPVNEAFLATQDNTYDVSVSLNDAQAYRKEIDGSDIDEDEDTPHLVARYNKIFGNTLTYAGLRARQEDGEQKAYAATGFTNVIQGFAIDGSAAMDEKANPAFELGTRKTIDNWRLNLIGRTSGEDFNPDGQEVGKYDVIANASKNFITPFDTYLNFNTGAQYRERHDDSKTSTYRAGVSHQMGRFNISDSVSYIKTDLGETQDNPDDRLDNTIAARMNLGKFYTSLGVDYNVKPDRRVDDYFAQISYRPTNRLTGDLYFEHDPNDRLSEARLNVNYRGEHLRVTPYVSANTDRDVETGVRLSTTLVDQPNKAMPLFTGDTVMGRGLVSSFVFHDKNGNNIFDGGDEPLPDVNVVAANVNRRDTTDAEGYSLIKDLPEAFVTDIAVDRTTLPDPFMIPGFAGVSVFPKAGQMIDLVFPVHLAGEVDGSVLVRGSGVGATPAANMPVKLYPIDGKSQDALTANAAIDGYYLFSNVPPGQYLLTLDATKAGKFNAGGARPVFVTIGYDGTVLSGKNLELDRGRVQTPLEYEIYEGRQYDKPFFALQVGSTAKSKLALVLEKLISRRTADMQKDLAVFPLEGGDNLKYLPGKGVLEHYDRCQALNDARVPCRMILYIPGKADPGIRTAQK